MYPELLRQTVLWPTIGHHDIGWPSADNRMPYLDMFTLPANGEAGGLPSGTERYYSFDCAHVHFVCMDSQSSDRSPGGAMLSWLEQDLSATSQEWIIAYWHHPPYSKGTHNSDGEPELIQMRQNVLPILERHGVDLVLSGHSHNYERSFLLNGHYGFSTNLAPEMVLDDGLGREPGGAYRKPAGGLGASKGAVYVVCGCSGEGGHFTFPQHPAMAMAMSGFGSMVLDIDGLRLDAKFLRESGLVEDYFTIVKGAPAAEAPPALSIRRWGNQARIEWPTSLVPFKLECAPQPGPGEDWRRCPFPPEVFGRRNVVTLELEGESEFFRLRMQD
jgi:hypothetical protein